MRELYLEKALKNFYLFQTGSTINCIATNISGLGFEYPTSFIKTSEQDIMSKIEMDLVFLNGYVGYKNFVDFISEEGWTMLHYSPEGDLTNKDYTCKINIERIDKGELGPGNSLICKVVLNKISRWFNFKQHTISVSSTAPAKIIYNNNTAFKVPITITFKNSVTNPDIKIYKKGQEDNSFSTPYSRCKLNYKSSGWLKIDSREGEEEMVDSVFYGDDINVYPMQDFRYSGFLYLNKGESVIVIEVGNTEAAKVLVTATYQYLGV